MDPCFHPLQRNIEDWHFWYHVRREILDALLKELHLPPDARLLDIGCGTGGSSLVLSKHGQAVGLDASLRSFQLSPDRPYTHRVVSSAEQLPFADASFDAVAALDVLEHLDHDQQAAEEIRRILKPGGAAVIFVPAFQILWGQNDVMSHHRRRYTKASLQKVLTAAGFRLSHLTYFNMLLFLPTLGVRLLERLSKKVAGQIEYQSEPTRLNSLLTQVFRWEVPLLTRLPLPIGTSVACIAHR
ncbi:MAG TPA: class I SAM-dependent methyltransferase [Pseudomonadota bacterium]|nr:class I SAM-dependent methyltransferase [Pseudomonadota bacterium]